MLQSQKIVSVDFIKEKLNKSTIIYNLNTDTLSEMQIE